VALFAGMGRYLCAADSGDASPRLVGLAALPSVGGSWVARSRASEQSIDLAAGRGPPVVLGAGVITAAPWLNLTARISMPPDLPAI
jgi:hypothetical protein